MAAKTYYCSAAVVDNSKLLSPAAITVCDGIIMDITNKRAQTDAIDIQDDLLLPGFINAHCHLELTKLGPLMEKNFTRWLKKLMAEKLKLTPQDIVDGVNLGINQLIRSGVTTVFDHISFDSPLHAYTGSPIDIIGFAEVLGADRERSKHIYTTQKERKQKAGFPYHLTPHAIHSLHPTTLHEVFTQQKKPFSIHLCESQDECLYFRDQAGPFLAWMPRQTPQHHSASAIEDIVANGHSLEKTLIVHANFVSAANISLIKKSQACVVHCPGSFYHFAHGNFPYKEFKATGVPIALGTDSLCSNTHLNMLAEAKTFYHDHASSDFFELLKMLTTNAARTIGLNDIGQISVGYKADMIAFPAEADLMRVFDNKMVRQVIKGGEVIFQIQDEH